MRKFVLKTDGDFLHFEMGGCVDEFGLKKAVIEEMHFTDNAFD